MLKLFVTCLLAVICNYASSLPATPTALACDKPNNPGEVDASKLISNIAGAVNPIQSTVLINGNVTIKIVNTTQTCCNKPNGTETHPLPQLPDGYESISTEGGYVTGIKLHSDELKFNDARKICAHEGGFVAYATSKEEEDLYFKKMAEHYVIEVWTGIHDLYEQFDWSTILGEVASKVAYFKWRPGQPDNSGNDERCTHNRRDGLNDISCTYNKFPFICKIKLPIAL